MAYISRFSCNFVTSLVKENTDCTYIGLEF